MKINTEISNFELNFFLANFTGISEMLVDRIVSQRIKAYNKHTGFTKSQCPCLTVKLPNEKYNFPQTCHLIVKFGKMSTIEPKITSIVWKYLDTIRKVYSREGWCAKSGKI